MSCISIHKSREVSTSDVHALARLAARNKPMTHRRQQHCTCQPHTSSSPPTEAVACSRRSCAKLYQQKLCCNAHTNRVGYSTQAAPEAFIVLRHIIHMDRLACIIKVGPYNLCICQLLNQCHRVAHRCRSTLLPITLTAQRHQGEPGAKTPSKSRCPPWAACRTVQTESRNLRGQHRSLSGADHVPCSLMRQHACITHSSPGDAEWHLLPDYLVCVTCITLPKSDAI